MLDGIRRALELAKVQPAQVGLIVHGTTLATNAIIERKGALTALVTTQGFRDSIEMAQENRFEQYDIFIEKPEPLVPRTLRFTIPERTDAKGGVRLALDEQAVETLAETLKAKKIEAVAIGYLHSYANPAHERRTAEILAARLPGVRLSVSSEVCPEVREYERFSTTCANAYVQPLMARYLENLKALVKQSGFDCPILLMTSGGGLTTLETAVRFPIRLVEFGSGRRRDPVDPYRREHGHRPHPVLRHGRHHRQDLHHRRRQADGLAQLRGRPPLPLHEGQRAARARPRDRDGRDRRRRRLAGQRRRHEAHQRRPRERRRRSRPRLLRARRPPSRRDRRQRRAGPHRSRPLRRRLDYPRRQTVRRRARHSCRRRSSSSTPPWRRSASPRSWKRTWPMPPASTPSSAAPSWKAARSIAFGGGAPLHAARLAEKLGITDVLIPAGAGVGSAVGFLRAPIAFEVVRSKFVRLSAFDPAAINAMFAEMEEEATGVVKLGAAAGVPIKISCSADMRYAGQGHEILVELPDGPFTKASAAELQKRFDAGYRALFSRVIPALDIEVVGWILRAETPAPGRAADLPMAAADGGRQARRRSARASLFDPMERDFRAVPVYARSALKPGNVIQGPAVIAEDETTTIITSGFTAALDSSGAIRLTARKAALQEAAQ